jgi:alcohol dehydrogenase class IV
MEELAAALPAVVQRGEDLALRTRAAWGSAMAGLALANARLGAAHALAHPLGVWFGIPHGLACGVLLAPVLEFNRPAAPAKYAAMERVFGGDPAAYARRLLAECGLPAKLTDYGLTAGALDPVAEETLPSGTLKANPRTATKEDLVGLLRALI